MDRLTVEDMLMLWPDDAWPQEVGAVGALDGGPLLEPDGSLRIDVVRRAVQARLHLVPRLRQVLRVPRRGLGRPVWVDDPGFDIAHHVRVAPLTGSAGETDLLQAVARLGRQRLDRSRPLWEMWLLPGLPDRRIGLFVRLHHVVADGVAAIATVGVFLDQTPDPPAEPMRPWTPGPAPASAALLADHLRQYALAGARSMRMLARPVTSVRRIRAGWRGMREAFAAVPTPDTSLNRTVGSERTIAVVRGDIGTVKRIARRHGAKVNDVVLAMTANGLRTLLRRRGEAVDQFPVYVPITLRPAASRPSARGNHIAQMIVPLPLGTTHPVQRLREIAAETARQKAKPHPALGFVLRGRIARRLLLNVLNRHPVSVTTADLAGPPEPVYLAGSRLLEVFPVVPLIGRVPIGVGALSYAGHFAVAVVADPAVCPDLDVFVDAARQELEDLAMRSDVEPPLVAIDMATTRPVP